MNAILINIFGFNIKVLFDNERLADYTKSLFSNYYSAFTGKCEITINLVITDTEEIEQRDRETIVYKGKKTLILENDKINYLGLVNGRKTSSSESLYYHLWLPFLKYIMQRHGFSAVHAAAIDINGVGILFCGNSNTGKSTLSVISLLNGTKFLNDDIVFLNHLYIAVSFYRPIHIFPEIAERLGIGERIDKSISYIKNREEVNYFYEKYHLYDAINKSIIRVMFLLSYNKTSSLKCIYLDDLKDKKRAFLENNIPIHNLDSIFLFTIEWGDELFERPQMLYELLVNIIKTRL